MNDLLQECLAVARGDKEAELVLKDVRIVNVYSGEIFLTDLAIHKGKIIGWGSYKGVEERNLGGRYILPGLIDAHLHLESTMVLPDEFCRQVVPRGTTTVAIDPHELANVSGVKGVHFFRQYLNHLPLNILIQLPSCVPATPAEKAGAVLRSDDLALLSKLPGVHGLGEVMDFPGVIQGDPQVLSKLKLMEGRFIDGHLPLVQGNDLNAYVLAGIMADHESTQLEEAREKVRRGLYIMVREGSAAKDLHKLLPLIKERNSRRFVFCTDDRHPIDLLEEGHLDYVVRRAIEAGLQPIEAIRMATLNAAECLGLRDVGGIGPGKRADLVVVDDLGRFNVNQVYKDGQLVAEGGELVKNFVVEPEIQLRKTVKCKDIQLSSLHIPQGEEYRVIQVISGQLLTKEIHQKVKIESSNMGDKILQPDIAKIIVVERHNSTGLIGVGLVKGFGLREGAFASSVAHDSHNLIAIGRDDQSILAALNKIINLQGGLAVARDGQILEALPLPIGGLISDQSTHWVAGKLKDLVNATKELGVILSDPFMTLSFMALPVIPELKITCQGLFDVVQNRRVDLTVG